MRYFIGFLIQGDAAKWHSDLARDISERFGTWKIHEHVPPHMTICRPFDADDVSPVRIALEKWAEAHSVPGIISLSGYDRFDDKVVFASVAMDNTTKEFVLKLRKEFSKILPREDFPNWVPHATLVDEYDTPEKTKQAWAYLQTLPKPHFSIPFDNITLFSEKKGNGWQVEKIYTLAG